MHDGRGEVLSDSTHAEVDRACAELAVVVARVSDGADRMEEASRGVCHSTRYMFVQ